MIRTIVVGDYANAVGGVLTLRGGEESWLDTIYVLDLPVSLPDQHPVWTTSVHVIDGDGDAIVEMSKGDDYLDLGAGADWAKAGCGNDVVFAGTGEDLIMGGCGADSIYLGQSDDVARGGYDDDLLAGRQGADSLYGDGGNDRLEGDAGGDDLHGGAGRDILVGGAGSDILVGGSGADEFHIGALDLDAVLDFNAREGDQLFVDGTDVTADADAWIGAGGVVVPPPAPELVAEAVQASDGATS